MINGTVVGLQALLSVIFLTEFGTREIECVVDTGFEGFLTLPSVLVAELTLLYVAPINANLADNSRIVTNVYRGIILWNEIERVIPVLEMGRRPLIGTALLEEYHLSIDFCEGGIVLVDEI